VRTLNRAAFVVFVSLAVACAGFVLAPSLAAQAKADQVTTKPVTPPPPKLTASAIQIEIMDPGDLEIPPDFRIAEYEYLVDQVTRTKKFQHVYRSGDTHAAGVADLITLRTTAESFKKGSEKKRDVTTVGGWTSIKLKAQFVDRSGKVVLEKEAEGKVRFMGGNLNATYDFAKKISAIIDESF
jgi:hypothetical protein